MSKSMSSYRDTALHILVNHCYTESLSQEGSGRSSENIKYSHRLMFQQDFPTPLEIGCLCLDRSHFIFKSKFPICLSSCIQISVNIDNYVLQVWVILVSH